MSHTPPKLPAVIILGALIVAFGTAWVGLSVSGIFAQLPQWVSYAIVGGDLVAIAIVWLVLTRRRS